jgi:hypothetical protein
VLLGNHHFLGLVLQKIRWFLFGAVIRWWFIFGDVDKVGNILCCSPISQIIGAVNKLYCFSLALPDELNTFSLVLQPNE